MFLYIQESYQVCLVRGRGFQTKYLSQIIFSYKYGKQKTLVLTYNVKGKVESKDKSNPKKTKAAFKKH